MSAPETIIYAVETGRTQRSKVNELARQSRADAMKRLTPLQRQQVHARSMALLMKFRLAGRKALAADRMRRDRRNDGV